MWLNSVSRAADVVWCLWIDLRAGYAAQRQAARSTTLIAGVVALVAFPLWGIFDIVVLAAKADSFIAMRAGFEVAIAVGWLGLWWRRVGGRWPEQAAFAVVALPELAISWMIPRSADRLGPYLLGRKRRRSWVAT